jgi:hypothetical protein
VKHPVVAFAALLGGGLAVLWWLDARTPPIAGVGGGSANGSATPRPVQATGRTTYAVRGPLESIRYVDAPGGGPRPRRYHVIAKDSGPTPDGDMELSDFSIALHDPQSDAQVARIEAVRGLIGVEPGEDLVGIALTNEAQLEQVVIDVSAGTRFAPLSITTPTAKGDLDAQRFWTPERAVATGVDITASGTGLDFEMTKGRLEFERDGTAAITTRDGRTARMYSRGELVWLQPPGAGARPMSVTANERGRLGLSGPEGLALSANTIELEGAADPEHASTFRFKELVARGEVELVAQGNTFRCREVRFVLSPDGALERVRLVGTVVGEIDAARIALPKEGAAAEPNDGRIDDRDRERLRAAGAVTLWGQGPMDLVVGAEGREEEGRFELAGPAELAFEDTRLWSEGGLTGRPGKKGEPLAFEAWTGVRVEHAGWTVRTEALTGTWNPKGDGSGAIALTAPGEARADGFDENGAPVALRARNGFDLAIDGAKWSVPIARGVDLSIGGERPISATAEVVTDFRDDELVGPSFTADEHVELIVDGQFLRGERLVAKGTDDLVVTSSDEPVTVDGPGLHAQARSLRRSGETLIAEGDVSAHVERDDLLLDVIAQKLELSGPLAPGDERPLRLRATGAVHADVTSFGAALADGSRPRTELTLDTPDLELNRRALPQSAFDETVVNARNGIVAKVRGEFGTHDVTARELDVLVLDRLRAVEAAGEALRPGESEAERLLRLEAERAAALDDLRGTLEARGDVVVASQSPTVLSGTGDTFFVDHEGRGRLVANPGKRVVANGLLPDSAQPFDVEASSIEFTAATLAALDTRIHVGDPTSGPLGGEGILVDLVANARRVRAEGGTLVFEENVSFFGTTRSLETFTLRCARATLTTDPPAQGETRRTPRELVADGGVRIVFSEGIDLEGLRLTADAFTQIVRIEGQPAVWRYQGIVDRSNFYEVDTLNMLVSAGPGETLPAGSGGRKQ